MTKKHIYVTKPSLPPLESFIPYLEEIWRSKILTNCGPYHEKLEEKLCEHLGVEFISLFTNATLALVTALRAMSISGEVITTPYSFVATTHSLIWNGLRPVFVDIEPKLLNIDPKKIEASITAETTAILAVHCYGTPCDTEAIQKIADNYKLKVIYDAAHAFGVNCHCGSILNHGDLSILSFHATKVFNTFEGGAIVSRDAESKRRIDQMKNFGFLDETTVEAIGINGKMSEFNAAFGLLQLETMKESIGRRKEIDTRYRESLKGISGINCLNERTIHNQNYAYFPILVESDFRLSRDLLYEKLKANKIFTRRYFYPLISEFPMYRNIVSANPRNLPVATSVASKVLCLPIYPDLSEEEQMTVIKLIVETS
jgi:dTDP-4-amino-4,6-dideoxygalactose transaminase